MEIGGAIGMVILGGWILFNLFILAACIATGSGWHRRSEKSSDKPGVMRSVLLPKVITCMGQDCTHAGIPPLVSLVSKQKVHFLTLGVNALWYS